MLRLLSAASFLLENARLSPHAVWIYEICPARKNTQWGPTCPHLSTWWIGHLSGIFLEDSGSIPSLRHDQETSCKCNTKKRNIWVHQLVAYGCQSPLVWSRHTSMKESKTWSSCIWFSACFSNLEPSIHGTHLFIYLYISPQLCLQKTHHKVLGSENGCMESRSCRCNKWKKEVPWPIKIVQDTIVAFQTSLSKAECRKTSWQYINQGMQSWNSFGAVLMCRGKSWPKLSATSLRNLPAMNPAPTSAFHFDAWQPNIPSQQALPPIPKNQSHGKHMPQAGT